MVFPKKNTRFINVDGEDYLWHLRARWQKKLSWIVISRKDVANRQLLFLDPYHHKILPTQGVIASAIRFGLNHGWDPMLKGPHIRLGYNGETFEKLPDDLKDWEHHQDRRYLQ